jgi:ATP-dependent exoDNAse (exonuclease V) alpha subunit
VILQGDTKQHQSVARGDALRLVQEKGGVAFASLKTIRRQENAEYRAAVESLVRGDTAEGFQKLEAMGAVREVAKDAARYAGIADSYAAKLERGHTVAVVAPTHGEIAKVTDAVREKLKALGKLEHERDTVGLVATGRTVAERGSAHTYEAGQVVEFRRNAPGFRNGDRATVWSVENGAVTVVRHGEKAERVTLDLTKAEAFEVYERRTLPLATGDTVRVTVGGKDASGKRLARGTFYEVRGFDEGGGLLLGSPGKAATRRVDASAALHLTHGYATTSHAAQGLTRHHVIAAMSSHSFGATSWEQFYVTLSRGKWSAEVWTDNADELRDEVARSGRRAFALDVKDAARKKPEPAPEKPRASRWTQALDVVRAVVQRRKRRIGAHEAAEAFAAPAAPKAWAEIEAEKERERGPSMGR